MIKSELVLINDHEELSIVKTSLKKTSDKSLKCLIAGFYQMILRVLVKVDKEIMKKMVDFHEMMATNEYFLWLLT